MAVSVAAYELGEARRWKRAALASEEQAEAFRSEAEDARLLATRQEGEIAKTRELSEAQLKLLTQTQAQLEEKFKALAADVLGNNSQLFLDRSRKEFEHLVETVTQSLRKF
ncbi:MAG: hypothetical protein M3Y24_12480, partial [Acidobacteriota bacterium]|nr:hypothetical protein [Acidobacteriota bacterium]